MSTLYARTLEIDFARLNPPFLSTDLPRTSVLKDLSQNEFEGSFSQNLAPQIMFFENILPTREGYDSIDQVPLIGPTSTPVMQHHTVITASNGINFFIAKTTTGFAAVAVGQANWIFTAIPGVTDATQMTYARLDGQTYIFFSNLKCVRFVPAGTSYTLQDFALTFQPTIPLGSILGITSASNYLIAFTADRILWDNGAGIAANDPAAQRGNFVPTLNGAGNTRISYLKGNIRAVHPLANGYVVYASENAVGAQFSGTASNPWTFREIPGSSGIRNQYAVAWSQNLQTHFAWTFSGLQGVSFSKAENLYPELSEFLNRSTLETFDAVLGLQRSTATVINAVKMELVAHRYMCISYGQQTLAVQSYQQALIYDVDLERWGKYRGNHVSFTQASIDERAFWLSYNDVHSVGARYNTYLATQYVELKQSTGGNNVLTSGLVPIDASGKALLLLRSNLNIPFQPGDEAAKFIIGKVSWNKAHTVQLLSMEIQNFESSGQFYYYGSFTNDGFEDVAPSALKRGFARHRSAKVTRYELRATARHFGLVFVGRFNLTNGLIQLQPAGRR